MPHNPSASYRLTFGRHKGMRIRDCPRPYVRWLAGKSFWGWFFECKRKHDSKACCGGTGEHDPACSLAYWHEEPPTCMEQLCQIAQLPEELSMLVAWIQTKSRHPADVQAAKEFLKTAPRLCPTTPPPATASPLAATRACASVTAPGRT